MALTTLGALVALIDSKTATLGITDSGGLWVAQIPENETTLPFVAVLHQGEKPEWTFERAYTETTTVEIHALAVGLLAAETLALALKGILDWTTALNVTNAAVIRCHRTDYRVDLAPFRDASGRLVFDATTTYEIEIRRTLARA